MNVSIPGQGANPFVNAEAMQESFIPPPIFSLEDTGLSSLWLQDLILKILYFQGYLTGFKIADEITLPFAGITDQLLEILKREKLVEVKTAQQIGLGEGAYVYGITGLGIARAREALDRSQYAGPAPVPLEIYNKSIRAQSRERMVIKDHDLRRVLSGLILSDVVYDCIGPAVNSGASIFLFGPPGNGKTSIARAIGRLSLNESMYIPYALYIDGQVVKLYDAVNQQAMTEEEPIPKGTGGLSRRSGTGGLSRRSGTGGLSGRSGTGGLSGRSGTGGLSGQSGTGGLSGRSGTGGLSGLSGTGGLSGRSGTGGLSGRPGTGGLSGRSGTGSMRVAQRRDTRWIRIHRPFVVVGGELTLAGLDLVFDDVNKYYEAPFQVKANGGILLIDDFGRQQVRPRDLLNRWIVPLENRIDYLTLHTGRKVEIPFDVLVVFSTNLPPKDLVDEAFLRRLRHKIEIGDPSYDEYRQIFKDVATTKGVVYSDSGLAYLLQEWYIRRGRKLRASHPRDLCDQILDISRYLNINPEMTRDLIDRAARAYFVEL